MGRAETLRRQSSVNQEMRLEGTGHVKLREPLRACPAQRIADERHADGAAVAQPAQAGVAVEVVSEMRERVGADQVETRRARDLPRQQRASPFGNVDDRRAEAARIVDPSVDVAGDRASYPNVASTTPATRSICACVKAEKNGRPKVLAASARVAGRSARGHFENAGCA